MPPVTVPVAGSITEPSPGSGLSAKLPPVTPVTMAVPPSQVAVIVNVESSVVITVKVSVLLDGQVPSVVYSTV